MALVFKPDWSVNIANVTVVVVALLGVIGAWYDVKSETRVNTRDIAVLQKEAAEYKVEAKADNLRQDGQRDAVVLDLKSTMQMNKQEIQADIKDLRRDLFPQPRR